jgi:hypothetical protein
MYLCVFSLFSILSSRFLVVKSKVPLNDKMNLRQRSVSIERDDEEGMEGLEEPLRAKKRRESRQGKQLTVNQSRVSALLNTNAP